MKQLLGAHMSVTGGYEQAIIRGESIGCTAVQIFTKSNRQWAAKPILPEQATLFKKTMQESCVQSVLAHASYLINIGSADTELAKKSATALIEELNRCDVLGIPYLVLHPGAFVKSTMAESLSLISQCLTYVLEKDVGKTMILLENTAGQGSSIGSTFEQLRIIYDSVKHKKRLGFCFDTCHAFAAGYDFSTIENYDNLWKHFDEILGIQNLKAFHMNDSVKERNSRLDRHAHIGKGKIGLEAFRLLMNDSTFYGIPKILETPKAATNLEEDQVNLDLLISLITKTDKKMR